VKYIDEYRDGERARRVAAVIAGEVASERSYRFMEFCGGHTHAIFRYGLLDLLPTNLRMVHGPGCPVCVLPISRVDHALALARIPGLILCSYGDMMRVPGSAGISLLGEKARGADVRMVYSSTDALRIATENPDREVVFFAIGFETTTPPTAVVLARARAEGLGNFTIFCNHVLTPAAITAILDVREPGSVLLDGFIGPAHVSAVIGSRPYEPFAAEYRRPVVIAGFEPLDILQAILMLVRQVNEARAEVENQYTRVVTREGNRKAQALVAEYFEPGHEFEWRGLGMIPCSGLRIRGEYREFDAEQRFEVGELGSQEHPGCACGAILRGMCEPVDCKLFAVVCTPDRPVGPCMVSSEGACAAYYTYRRRYQRREVSEAEKP
jgi:hydrogenase expression/formation protein HypD